MEHKDTEQKYDLYTEKIVLSPKVKYKNLIRTIKILDNNSRSGIYSS